MARLYLETSFINACVTDRTDPASVYRNDVSQEWWDSARAEHEVFASAEVVAELEHPTQPNGRQALELIHDLQWLPMTDEVRGLSHLLVQERVLPGPTVGDAVHVALAAAHHMDYLVTWDLRHLANPYVLAHLRHVCLRVGLTPPYIVTSESLWEPNDEFEGPASEQ